VHPRGFIAAMDAQYVSGFITVCVAPNIEMPVLVTNENFTAENFTNWLKNTASPPAVSCIHYSLEKDGKTTTFVHITPNTSLSIPKTNFSICITTHKLVYLNMAGQRAHLAHL